MTRIINVMLMAGGLALASTAVSAPAAAQTTPKGWNYEIKDGKRVPKAQRKVAPDGGWREEVKQGSCITIKEKTATGEYKESRRCD